MPSDGLAQRAGALQEQIVRWRRELHQHPELGFDLPWTSAFVIERLHRLGIEVHPGLGRSGVVGILRAATRSGGAVLLRADMDALPIQEVDGREYGSRHPGRMHACGHDAHTSMLLGAATLLQELTHVLPRDVLLCFQPAEEGEGGARAMLDDGVLQLAPVTTAYALHVWSPFPAGTLHVRPGPIMAAQDEFTATFVGRGGHGALPHQAIDPIVAAAHGVLAVQSVVSRTVDPVQPAVVTVGSLHAGSAPNVIPETARLDGTMRSFDPSVRELLREHVRRALEGAARGAGCRLDWELRPGYPAVVNDAAAVARLREAAGAVLGADAVVETPPLAAAEDFAYFLERVPGAFALLGAGNLARGITAPHHAAAFDIDETVLSRGAELLARLALTP